MSTPSKRTQNTMPSTNTEASAPQSAIPTRNPVIRTLIADIRSIFNSSKYSDLTITCQDRAFHAHKLVVCLQSKHLAAHVDDNVLNRSVGIIDLPADDPEAVERMLCYLYDGNYEDESHRPIPPSASDPSLVVRTQAEEFKKEGGEEKLNNTVSTTVFHYPGQLARSPSLGSTSYSTTLFTQKTALSSNTKVYVLADKYDIKPLKRLAAQKYVEALRSQRTNSAISYGPFFESVKLMYTDLPDNDRLLKDQAVKFADQTKELANMKEFEVLCQTQGQFAYDLYKTGRAANEAVERSSSVESNRPSKKPKTRRQ